MAWLSEWPFDSFQQDDTSLRAYIGEDPLARCRAEVEAFLRTTGVQWSLTTIETVNWNALWESSFEPVEVEGLCIIRAPFHPAPENGVTDIVIMPKMSFGTGHHATTWLMVGDIMRRDLTGQTGLDMGSGTGVLAIAAALQGAAHIDAIDIDQWARENCEENVAANGVADRITPILGDASAIPAREYDFILANINRNILLADMQAYVNALKPGGSLIMSGILEGDIEAIEEKAAELGLTPSASRPQSLHAGWASVSFVK